MEINIGISDKDRKAIADGLARVMADTYSLYLKTHNYHWNVTGPMFQTLHLMFEQEYNELWTAVDLIAERIRALGHFAPGTYKALGALSSIAEDESIPAAKDMIKRLRARSSPSCHGSAYTGHFRVGVIRPAEAGGGAGRSRHIPASVESAYIGHGGVGISRPVRSRHIPASRGP